MNRIEDKEQEPRGSILVLRADERYRLVEERDFLTPSDAFHYIMERGEVYKHQLIDPLEFDMQVSLIGNRWDQHLLLQIGDRTGIAPRTVDGHHAVQAPYDKYYNATPVNLIVHLEGTHPGIDRDVVWVNIGTASLKIGLLPYQYTFEDLELIHRSANDRVRTVIQDILERKFQV